MTSNGCAAEWTPNAQVVNPDKAGELALAFFRVFADPWRLRLAARLLSGPATPAELMSEFGLDVRSLMRHLSRLARLGLVTEANEEGRRVFRFHSERLRTMAATALRRQQGEQPVDERSRTLATFLHNGRLLRIPAQQRKQLYVLAEIANRFQPGRTYSEREVNAILKDFYPDDYTTLRRLLVDFGFLKRDNASGGAIYTKGLAPEAVLAGYGVQVTSVS